MACAEAFDRYQTLIVCDAKAAGASFVVAYHQTEHKNHSPNVTSKKLNTSHIGLIADPPDALNGITISKKDAPARITPIENFTGVLGCFFPHFVHMTANNGAKNTI